MLVAIDAFPDSMIFKYENVTDEDAPKIVYDLLFPRGPLKAQNTPRSSSTEATSKWLKK